MYTATATAQQPNCNTLVPWLVERLRNDHTISNDSHDLHCSEASPHSILYPDMVVNSCLRDQTRLILYLLGTCSHGCLFVHAWISTIHHKALQLFNAEESKKVVSFVDHLSSDRKSSRKFRLLTYHEAKRCLILARMLPLNITT